MDESSDYATLRGDGIPPQAPGTGENQQIRNLVAGTMGGWAQTTVGHPFDTIKVRMQTTEGASLVECVKETSSRGVADFYRGIASPLLGQGLMNALQYATYGNMKVLCGGDDRDIRPLSPERYLLVGALTGVVISCVDCPVDLFKIKMQVQSSTGTDYRGVLDCFRRIAAEFGVRGVYQGLGATLIRNVPCNALYFGTYEKMRQELARLDGCDVRDLRPGRLLLAGGAAGFSFWAFLYPVEVVKSSIQGDASDRTKRQYAGWIDCARKIYARRGGLSAFWRGYVPCIMRSVPANAACFYAYETTRKILMDRSEASSRSPRTEKMMCPSRDKLT